jgi:Gpi18-like mannosyltransferase
MAFILFKIQFLSLPYFWDESWVYTRAIYEMIEKGPSLLPGSINADLYTGHPLMFYFLSSLWMSVMGTDVTTAHIFPLILACILFIIVYLIVNKTTNEPILASFASIIVAWQPVTLAQSGMMLSEILLTIFTLLSLYFFLKKQTFWMVFFMSCLILTKEAGIVMCLTLSMFGFLEALKTKKTGIVLKSISIYSIPFFVGFLFYLIQKIRLGWFFYPRHTGWIDLSLNSIFDKMSWSLTFIFSRQGRIIFIAIIAIYILLLLFKKIKFNQDYKSIFTILSTFIIIYILFCSINFLSTRYLYSTIPAVIILIVIMCGSLFTKKNYYIIVMSLLCVFSFTMIPRSYKADISDVDLTYSSLVNVHSNMVKYCESKNLYNTHITTHFLMIEQLSHKTCGYLSGNEFSHVDVSMDDDTKYLILSPVERDFNLDELNKKFNITLEKKFESGVAWCEIYKVSKKAL